MRREETSMALIDADADLDKEGILALTPLYKDIKEGAQKYCGKFNQSWCRSNLPHSFPYLNFHQKIEKIARSIKIQAYLIIINA